MTAKPTPPSRTAEQFVVRLPDGMRDRIAEEAKKNNRSMNAEIVARLQDSFDSARRPIISINADSYEEAIAIMGKVVLASDAARPEALKQLDPGMRETIESAVEKAESTKPPKKPRRKLDI